MDKLAGFSKMLMAIRRFFCDHHDYLEVFSPVLVTCPGSDIHMDFFSTQWQEPRFGTTSFGLRSSPELSLKKLIAQGQERIFEIGPCFRNGAELGPWHSPEFLMLEWYKKGASLEDLIDETINLVAAAAGTLQSAGYDVPAHLSKARRMSLDECFENWVGTALVDGDQSLASRLSHLPSILPGDDFETAFFKVLVDVIEPRLGELGAVALHGYPASQASLACIEGGRSQRFELYLDGVEICNGFQELLGAAANRDRFANTNARRASLGKPPLPEDLEFFEAMDRLEGNLAGNALGLERLFSVLSGSQSLSPRVAGLSFPAQ